MAVDKKAERILKLIGEIRERLDELEAAAGSDLPDVSKLGKRAIDTFCRLWTNRYREPYLPNWAVDRGHVKRFLTKGVPVERLEAKMAAFILDNDPALVRARHPFNWFVSRFNTIRVDVDGPDAPAAPVDCRHRPPCKSDIEHTSKSMRESRA